MNELIVQPQFEGNFDFGKELAGIAKHSSQALKRISKAFSGIQEASAQFSEGLKLDLGPLYEASGAIQIPKMPDFQGMLAPVFPDFLIHHNQKELEYQEQRSALKKSILSTPATYIQEKNWHRYLPELKPFELMSEAEFDRYAIPFFGGFIPSVRIRDIFQFGVRYGLTKSEIGKMTVRETVDWFDEYEEFDMHMARIDGQIIEGHAVEAISLPICEKRGKVSKNQALIEKLVVIALTYVNSHISCYMAAGRALDEVKVAFSNGPYTEQGNNVFVSNANNPRKAAQTMIEREMKKRQS